MRKIDIHSRYSQVKGLQIALFCAVLYFFSKQTLSHLQEIESTQSYSPIQQLKLSHVAYSCLYRDFEAPSADSGLPHLGEVFATDQGKNLYFVTINLGACEEKYKDKQDFHRKGDVITQFKCVFPDGSFTYTDPVHPRSSNRDKVWTNAVMVIRCSIPAQYQALVQKPTATTRFTVALHSLKLKGGSFKDIPVCHSEHPAYDGSVLPSKIETGDKQPYAVSLFVRIKVSYTANGFAENLELDQESIVSWIEYHLAIGFEHFYIYDNGNDFKGKLFDYLFSYIENRIVTYVWAPSKDCIRDYDVEPGRYLAGKGSQYRIGQYIGGNAVLRRYAHETRYLAAWDVDEYLVLPDGVSKVTDLLDKAVPKNHDAIIFEEKWFGACNGDTIDNDSMLRVERAKCFKDDTTPPKPIMKTDRMLYFLVHYPNINIDHKIAEFNKDKTTKNGFLAHFRKRTYYEFDHENFKGHVISNFTQKNLYFSKWHNYLRSKFKIQVDAYIDRLRSKK